MKLKKYIYMGIAVLVLNTTACTDLEPEIYTDVLKDEYYKTPSQFATLLANAYTQLAGEYGYVFREGYWSMQEYTTDAVIVPTRGTEWFDNGVPVKMHQHTWETDTRDINNGWSFAYGGVGKCNEVLSNIVALKGNNESLYDDITKSGIAETKVLRAFYHLLAMDLYGNIAISINLVDPPKQSSRDSVFRFIEKEILENIDALQRTKSYGRVTKSVAHTILAKMYLNAEVYTGTPRWADAVAQCDSVLHPDFGYQLASNYFAPFAINNVNNSEIILPVVFDAVYAKGNMFHLMTLHYSQQEVYGFTTKTWNGPCTLEEYYNKYASNDARKKQWFVGPIVDATGDTLNFIKGSVNAKAIIVPQVTTISDATEQNTFEGARFVKFEIERGIEHNANNDFPIYRLADIYLMKAEALMRINGGTATQEAVDAANMIRPRTGLANYTTATLTLNELLDERARELAWEGHRRQDLIRFDKFKDAWAFKEASARTRYLFPIPKWVRDGAPGVYEQNPGY